MLTTKLTVEIVGYPNLQGLSENKKQILYDTLLRRITELKKNDEKQ